MKPEEIANQVRNDYRKIILNRRIDDYKEGTTRFERRCLNGALIAIGIWAFLMLWTFK